MSTGEIAFTVYVVGIAAFAFSLSFVWADEYEDGESMMEATCIAMIWPAMLIIIAFGAIAIAPAFMGSKCRKYLDSRKGKKEEPCLRSKLF